MMTPQELELLARLKREDIVREVASARRADSVQRPTRGPVLRRRLAALLMAVATRLVPATAPASEAGVEMRTVNS